jgi:hypothetical protein
MFVVVKLSLLENPLFDTLHFTAGNSMVLRRESRLPTLFFVASREGGGLDLCNDIRKPVWPGKPCTATGGMLEGL